MKCAFAKISRNIIQPAGVIGMASRISSNETHRGIGHGIKIKAAFACALRTNGENKRIFAGDKTTASYGGVIISSS